MKSDRFAGAKKTESDVLRGGGQKPTPPNLANMHPGGEDGVVGYWGGSPRVLTGLVRPKKKMIQRGITHQIKRHTTSEKDIVYEGRREGKRDEALETESSWGWEKAEQQKKRELGGGGNMCMSDHTEANSRLIQS